MTAIDSRSTDIDEAGADAAGTERAPSSAHAGRPLQGSGMPRSAPAPSGLDPEGAVALALSAVWVLGIGAALMLGPAPGLPAPFGWIAATALVVLPLGFIWLAALAVRAVRVVRGEARRLEAAIDALRAVAAQGAPKGSGLRAPVEAKLEELARAQRQTEAAIARLTQSHSSASTPGTSPGPTPGPALARRAAAPATSATVGRAARDGAQQSLALDAPDADEAPEPLSNDLFLKALNFPEDESDTAGFRALRAALKHRGAADLVRSAQDMLTLLAEDGIYMDDLAPDLARPEIWRQFAHGERGRAIASLGGVRDRSCLALTAGRMRQDPVFRDTAHHFLRKFDRAFAAFEPEASDADIVALAETRTARAFMLLGRVAGTFD